MLRYAITDRQAIAGDEALRELVLLKQVRRLARDGVDFVQVREKDLPFAVAAALAERLQQAVDGLQGNLRVLLNAPWPPPAGERWPRGVGLHLSSAALAAFVRHGSERPAATVSAACHTLEEALEARPVADLLLASPVFEKRVAGTQVRNGSGMDFLKRVAEAVAPLPVLALGGVTPANLQACMAAGAAGVAGIRLFQSAQDCNALPGQAASEHTRGQRVATDSKGRLPRIARLW